MIVYLFRVICVWLRWVFVAAHGLSLAAVSGGYSLLVFSLRQVLCCKARALGARASVVAERGLSIRAAWA